MDTDTTLLGTDGQENTAADTGQQTPAEGAPAPTEGTTPPAEGTTPPVESATPGEEGKTEDKAPPANPFHGAPEEDYGDITAPEGEAYVPAVVDSVKALSKELGLNLDGAKKLTSEAHRIAKAASEAQVEALKQARAEWRDQAKADKDIGGKNFEANLALAAKARQNFGDSDLLQVLNESGLGDHPAVIRAFVKIGKAISDDSIVVGNRTAQPEQRSVAQRLYPQQNPN